MEENKEIKNEKEKEKDLDVLSDDINPIEIKEEEDEFSMMSRDKMKTTIVELQNELDKLKNEYARAYADTENMRKRLQSEADNVRKYRIQSFAMDILPVIDNVERALAQEVNEANEAFYTGVKMIYVQLVEALKKEGVTEIEAQDKEFDPNFHQAIMTEKVEGVKPGMVIQVLQKGYMLKDRILRASMVKVSE